MLGGFKQTESGVQSNCEEVKEATKNLEISNWQLLSEWEFVQHIGLALPSLTGK